MNIVKSTPFKIIVGSVVLLAVFMVINVISSPQMALYHMLGAVKTGNVATFAKYYAVADPALSKHDELSDSAKKQLELKQFKDQYFKDISFFSSLFLKTQTELVAKGTVNAGTLLSIKSGSHTIYYRMVRNNGGWQVADVAKL